MSIPSEEALRWILRTIAVSKLKDGTNVEWMSLWDVRVASGYSLEYTRTAIRSLYWEYQALNRMQKGPAFYYRVSAKGEDLLQQWWKKKGKQVNDGL
jgi:hypothetical protein